MLELNPTISLGIFHNDVEGYFYVRLPQGDTKGPQVPSQLIFRSDELRESRWDEMKSQLKTKAQELKINVPGLTNEA